MEFSKIKKVYMLYHINSINDKKVIGFFSSKEKALQILQEYKTKDGFKNEQNNFFLKTMGKIIIYEDLNQNRYSEWS